ncbi:MAG: hypothetical protein AAF417_17655 [Pseudomonadota bacterium]
MLTPLDRMAALADLARSRGLRLLAVTAGLGLLLVNLHAEPPERIINSHMHSAYLGMDDAGYRQQVLEGMDALNIRQSVLHLNEPEDIEDWVEAAPGRFLAGPAFPCFAEAGEENRSCRWDGGDWPIVDWLRSQFEQGTLTTMGEMLFVYAGIAPTDSRMAP